MSVHIIFPQDFNFVLHFMQVEPKLDTFDDSCRLVVLLI